MRKFLILGVAVIAVGVYFANRGPATEQDGITILSSNISETGAEQGLNDLASTLAERANMVLSETKEAANQAVEEVTSAVAAVAAVAPVDESELKSATGIGGLMEDVGETADATDKTLEGAAEELNQIAPAAGDEAVTTVEDAAVEAEKAADAAEADLEGLVE